VSRFKSPFLIALLNGLLGALLFLSPWAAQLEEDFGLGWLFLARGPRPAPEQVALVTMDTESMKALGLERLHRKWPRRLHARLIERLSAAGAAVISFDVFFRERRDAAGDQALAEAMRKAGNVLLFQQVQKDALAVAGGKGATVFAERLLNPAPPFADAATALAPFTLPGVPVKVSQFWKFKPEAGDVPTLPAMAFQYYALGVYEALHGLPPLQGRSFPKTSGAMLREPGLSAYMRRMRTVFMQQEDLGPRLRQSLSMQEPPRRRLLSSLIALYEGPHSQYLNYYGPPRTLRSIPYHRVLRMPAAELEARFGGKAVFVGVSEAFQWDQKDTFYTVYSDSETGHNISGVEIAATAFGNLLQGTWLEPLGTGYGLTLVFLWGGLVGFLCRSLPAGWAVFAVVAMVPLYLLAAHGSFAGAGLWLPLVVPVFAQTLPVLFFTLLLGYREAHGERTRIAAALGRYLPEQAVKDLAESVHRTGGPAKMVHGVCMATDAEQYTRLSEQLGPRELRELMNAYYEIIFDVIHRRGGFVSDVVGDSVLALWVASQSQAGQRAQACHAALDVLAAVSEFNRSRDALRLPTRIGLHYGEVCIGDVGAGRHFEYRAIGDVVNTATRIEGANKFFGTRLLISEEGLEGVGDMMTRELGLFRLAGKSREVRLFELMGREPGCSECHPGFVTEFGRGLAAFRRHEWEAAFQRFSNAVRMQPDDGPSRFYLELSDKYRHTPPGAYWDGVVDLAIK